ncbi:putative ClpP/crotonase-like domain-containing protein [Rosa chinensis]|uniref:Putative ClpP/crotonase-like domain-containing protein n=1 Tax=Rosa chinensis TaxID=74649 RepID=A0A2P6PP49_ROSCH|nr:putative ClpP/crotonase-like domain-containing protein [Rosa chinensis]
MLTALLDNIYGNWLDIISSTREKKREDIEKSVNEGVYHVEKLKERARSQTYSMMMRKH